MLNVCRVIFCLSTGRIIAILTVLQGCITYYLWILHCSKISYGLWLTSTTMYQQWLMHLWKFLVSIITAYSFTSSLFWTIRWTKAFAFVLLDVEMLNNNIYYNGTMFHCRNSNQYTDITITNNQNSGLHQKYLLPLFFLTNTIACIACTISIKLSSTLFPCNKHFMQP